MPTGLHKKQFGCNLRSFLLLNPVMFDTHTPASDSLNVQERNCLLILLSVWDLSLNWLWSTQDHWCAAVVFFSLLSHNMPSSSCPTVYSRVLKKSSQELYGLICYAELRKKVGGCKSSRVCVCGGGGCSRRRVFGVFDTSQSGSVSAAGPGWPRGSWFLNVAPGSWGTVKCRTGHEEGYVINVLCLC